MSDNLRARIIAAIAKADQNWCSDNPLHEDMADAVIRELMDQCGQCWRSGDKRDGCNCVYPKGHPSRE